MGDINKRFAAILPIRSGSKRIPNKNIRRIGYYPLFYHIINTCTKIDEIEEVVVSVDCKVYADIVNECFHRNNKIRVIYRPDELADGETKSEDVMIHAMQCMREENISYDYYILLQATTPLTSYKDIKSAISLAVDDDSLNSVFSASESKRFYLDDYDELIKRPMTQNKSPKIYEVGCFWVVKSDVFYEKKNRIIPPYKYVMVDEYNALDIDEFKDMEVVNFLLSKKVREEDHLYYLERELPEDSVVEKYYFDKKDPDGVVRNILFEKEGRVEFCSDEVEYINNIVEPDGKRSRILSIGCGAGYAETTISGVYEKYGVEPDIEAFEMALNNKVFDFLYNKEFDSEDYALDFFDVVLCHHVIEHVDDPVGFIKGVNSIMKPNGVLVIGTPNFDSAMARRYGHRYRMLSDPTHISLFSDMSLRDLLIDNMFDIEKIEYPYFDTKYFSRSEVLRLFQDGDVSPAFYGNIFTIYAKKI